MWHLRQQSLTGCFPSFLSCFLAKLCLHFASSWPAALREKTREETSFSTSIPCPKLEISALVLQSTPYKCSLRRFKAIGEVVLEEEALSYQFS